MPTCWTFSAGVGILLLINRIEGHVRFLPLLAGLTLLYAVGKELHLSPLVLILVFGLLLNNTQLLQRVGRMGDLLREFKGLVVEFPFGAITRGCNGSVAEPRQPARNPPAMHAP